MSNVYCFEAHFKGGDFEAQWSEAFDLLRTGRGYMKSLPSKLQRWARKERKERKGRGNA